MAVKLIVSSVKLFNVTFSESIKCKPDYKSDLLIYFYSPRSGLHFLTHKIRDTISIQWYRNTNTGIQLNTFFRRS